MDLVQPRQNRCDPDKKFLSKIGNYDSAQTTTESQDQVFRKDALEQPPPSCSESGSKSHLMLAGHAPRQLQVREIHTRHQQNTRDRSQQQPQGLASVSSDLL